MKLVTISLKALHDKFGEHLENGEIVKSVDGDYYDLQTNVGVVCMDGETCMVVDSGEFGYELLNNNGERDMKFILTDDEYSIGAFEVI